ncbi:1-acyl-sn-glycerol-3-phosphate acyltransferase [Patescibacteria group bacterium]|nr:1-acyl-sn-glycerol-3-phosphate acyltransferase [Patescibacteria group bacterium]
MGYYILKYLFYPFIKLFWLDKISGLNNIPKKGSFIIVANHKSYLDFILLFTFIPRRISFLAAEVFFKSKLWHPIMKITGQIKVDRESPNKGEVYKNVDRLFKKGGVLGIFPEGTRSRDGKLHKGYNGAVKFSFKYQVPIIPIGLINTFDAFPPHSKKPRLVRCIINIGESFYLDSTDYDIETSRLMNKIAKLSGEVYED